jgi:2,4-dienoyl-CoA reductase-like NADH-dependent reductase (Old Yellow Enzyme family)/NADPH-dependent 2,4-dienoyl-CoA reductase/sulfur reductase-like enzyme
MVHHWGELKGKNMGAKYRNLLSPIKIGSTVYKNRLIASRYSPRFIQGSENYPTQALITHYANKAKNGMAVVTCSGVGVPPFVPEELHATVHAKSVLPGHFDIEDHHCQTYLSQLTEAIHFYGAKASMQINGFVPFKYDVSSGIPSVSPSPEIPSRTGEEIPEALLEGVVEDYVRQSVILKSLGFDMVHLHMAYQVLLLGRFLSPLTNKRTDKFGGSPENRTRFAIMVADRIKQACGKDFLIEACISGCEKQGGITVADTIEFAKLFAGHIDLLHIRGGDMDAHHTVGFERNPNPFLKIAAAVKKSKANIAVVANGGFQDPEVCEKAISSGQADFIAIARGLISNPEYGRLLYEGRPDDIVPCIRCNFCLRSSPVDPLVSVCSVNPIWGLEHTIEGMLQPPGPKKKVAIIGGGPAGMKAALVSAQRGHAVTLYEKSDALGGLLKTAKFVSFKWPLKDFTEYLIRQVSKANVEVLLNTEATPEKIKAHQYDVVIAGMGAEPITPAISGIDNGHVAYAVNVYGYEDTYAQDIVIIGGGEVGVETGMHLAETGHQVMVLEMQDGLALQSPPLHFYTMFKEAWEKLPNFKYALKARCTGIEAETVTYLDADNKAYRIKAGSVIVAVGMKPKIDQALRFYGSADQFHMIGDCNIVGTVQKAIRSAYSTASML